MQLMHEYNCLVIILEYRLALHAMTLMGGAAASENSLERILWYGYGMCMGMRMVWVWVWVCAWYVYGYGYAHVMGLLLYLGKLLAFGLEATSQGTIFEPAMLWENSAEFNVQSINQYM